MHMIYETEGMWGKKKKHTHNINHSEYKDRDMQENKNKTNNLTKVEKENHLTKLLYSDVNFVFLNFLRSQVNKILKCTFEIERKIWKQ